MSTNQITRIGQGPNFASQVGAHLPESSCMKPEPLPFHQLVEINVDRSADSLPPGSCLPQATARIGLQISNVEKVELDTFFFQGRSPSTPVAEQVLARPHFKQRGPVIGCKSIR